MTLLYFVLAAVALGILVFIHELGHYFVAKKAKMTVEVFSIGFGKPMLKWRWNNVDWQLCWLPFGGYVKIAGMELGKKEKEQNKEPHEIPDGFFSKSPLKRICVAFAGPLSNFILALLLFAAIWAIGGREKPFSDFTHIVGWVDPKSDLFAEGLRPGDQITEVNGKRFKGSKDLLYAAIMGGNQVTIAGFHVDLPSGEKTAFTLTSTNYPASGSIEGMMTTGVSAMARYLVYDRFPDGAPNPLASASPMQGSSLSYGDRLVWADGEYLFSLDQLSHLLNDSRALLTVKRGESIFLSRQPRVVATDLSLPQHVRNELIDWQYEMHRPLLMGKWEEWMLLPYIISSEGYIEDSLAFIDDESKLAAFPHHPYSEELDSPLQPGDQILAVDGSPIGSGYEILALLQERHANIIVQRADSVNQKLSWKDEDNQFMQALLSPDIKNLAKGVGLSNREQKSGQFTRLAPVEPKPVDTILRASQGSEELKKQIDARMAVIEKIGDSAKRARALKLLEENQHRLVLGVTLQDREVEYNPSPFTLFGSVFTETWSTLKALVTGNLNPKWISGPIGIVQVIHHGWKEGVMEAFFWIGAISVNLGVLNLLPIPVLDGGYIFLSLWELITRRRLKAKTMERLIIPFVVLLIGLLIFLTFQDLSRLF